MYVEEIDMNLLSSAMILYREAYEAKEGRPRYYDAINFAYLYNIVGFIQRDTPPTSELKKIYQELSAEWEIDQSNWWEVSSDAEFLMLIGQIDLAIFNINDFFENHPVEKFNIEATLRQLEIYRHFGDDEDANKFYEHLLLSWQHIEQ
jgi:hypothetical protein